VECPSYKTIWLPVSNMIKERNNTSFVNQCIVYYSTVSYFNVIGTTVLELNISSWWKQYMFSPFSSMIFNLFPKTVKTQSERGFVFLHFYHDVVYIDDRGHQNVGLYFFTSTMTWCILMIAFIRTWVCISSLLPWRGVYWWSRSSERGFVFLHFNHDVVYIDVRVH